MNDKFEKGQYILYFNKHSYDGLLEGYLLKQIFLKNGNTLWIIANNAETKALYFDSIDSLDDEVINVLIRERKLAKINEKYITAYSLKKKNKISRLYYFLQKPLIDNRINDKNMLLQKVIKQNTSYGSIFIEAFSEKVHERILWFRKVILLGTVDLFFSWICYFYKDRSAAYAKERKLNEKYKKLEENPNCPPIDEQFIKDDDDVNELVEMQRINSERTYNILAMIISIISLIVAICKN